MTEEAIIVLTKMMIKEHISNNQDKYIFTKEELIKFCIKLIKVINQVEN